MEGLQIILLVVGIIFFLVILFVEVINKIAIPLLHAARIVFLMYWTKNDIGPIFSSDLPTDLVFITAGFTIVLTVVGFGSSMFANTIGETGNTIMEPIEGGGYRLSSEVTGSTPIGTFIYCIFRSIIAGIGTLAILMILIRFVADTPDQQIRYVLIAGIILSIIGIVRGIISFIKFLKWR